MQLDLKHLNTSNVNVNQFLLKHLNFKKEDLNTSNVNVNLFPNISFNLAGIHLNTSNVNVNRIYWLFFYVLTMI